MDPIQAINFLGVKKIQPRSDGYKAQPINEPRLAGAGVKPTSFEGKTSDFSANMFAQKINYENKSLGMEQAFNVDHFGKKGKAGSLLNICC